MRVQSTLYDRISGSLGQITGQQGRGGNYFKAKPNPSNPNSTYQQAVRNALSAANLAWRAGTQAQREAWQEYGATCSYENNTGARVTLTGWNAFSRVYVVLSQASQTVSGLISARPVQNSYQPSAPLVLSENDTTSTTLDILNSGVDAVRISIYEGAVTNPTVNSYSGSYRFLNHFTLEPNATNSLLLALSPGRNWFRAQSLSEDGRLGRGVVYFVDV